MWQIKPVKVVLDGAQCVGKSVFMNRLSNGKYKVVIPPTIGAAYGIHKVMINQVKYVAHIWDTSGLEKLFFDVNKMIYRSSDVVVEFFAIDELCSLKQSIHIRIPHLRIHFPEIPILLVGARADLRQVEKEQLFPCELGPFLAKFFGAFMYLECSSKTNFNVREVFEEAVRRSLSESNLEFIDKHLNDVMNFVSEIDSEWAALFGNLGHSFLNTKPCLKQDIDLIEDMIVQIPSEIKKDSRKEVFIYHVLEFDRLQISHALLGTSYKLCESSSPTTCTLWYVHTCSKDQTQIVQCRLFSVNESHENVVCSKCPANLRFFAIDYKAVASFLINTTDRMKVRSLIFVNCYGILDFSFLTKLTGLEYLIIVNTEIDLASLIFPPHLHETIKHLVLNHCGITQATDVPSEIGKLVNLQLLNIVNNNFKKLPTALGFLDQLHTLLVDNENVSFPPPEVLKRPTKDVINFLEAVGENPVANTESKLIVVGQEGVGKSTLIKAMKRSFWLTKNKPAPKTDGVDISVLPLKDIQCKVYDLAGDVEYLNTHSLFLSPNTLHLVVYDLSRVIIDKGARSVDHLCRLELWLETIASQGPKSNVILVGTHADHLLVNREIIMNNRKLLAEVLIKHCSSHKDIPRTDQCEECFICNPEKCPENLECLNILMTNTSSGEHSDALKTSIQIPHILGYFEVSSIQKYPSSLLGVHNTNVDELKSLSASSISNMMKTTETKKIPKQWLSFCKYITQKLSSDDHDDMKVQPLMALSLVHEIALELKILRKKRVVAMLRFFHSQGTYLWYEDLPEMKNIVILDPQWLSDQLRTLISYRPSVGSICDGVLHLPELSTVWAQMSDDNRQNLLSLFRNVGLCFSISDTEELFPCNLPVGWPDREIWPPMPKPEENQTSLLFEFSFVPPSFFPDLIVEVNKKNETFARNVKPLYYRFHIVYIRKHQILSASLDNLDVGAKEDATKVHDVCPPSRVHYELMPYNNSLTVAVRGPDPPSIIPDIRATIETVRRLRYPGIMYSESMLCPECVMKRVQPPASFGYNIPHDGVCSKGHIVGSIQNIFDGKYSSAEIVPSAIAQTGRIVGETLEDHFCPKLFVVLPINLEGLSLKDRFVYSYIRDGYAVHLLCECPGQWHFVDSPGFRVGKPKEFFEKYGNRVCKVLRFISTLSTPMKAAASLDPHCKIGAAVGVGAKSVCQDLQTLLESYLDKYPHLKPSLVGSSKDDIKNLKSSSGLQRSELSRFLEIEAKGRNFGPLVCTYVDKCNGWLWLCEEHNERFEIVQRDNEND